MQILVLTMHAEQQYAVRAFRAGASGYMTKESASAELIAALTKIAAGGVYVSLTMAEQFAQSLNEPTDLLPHQRLSDREFDVFRRVTIGESISEIAEALCVSVKTVSTYKTRILEKMQMPNDTALVRYAMRHKLFDDPDDLTAAPAHDRCARASRPDRMPHLCRKPPTSLPCDLLHLQWLLISLTPRNIHTPDQEKQARASRSKGGTRRRDRSPGSSGAVLHHECDNRQGRGRYQPRDPAHGGSSPS